jgi:hypothetical protein
MARRANNAAAASDLSAKQDGARMTTTQTERAESWRSDVIPQIRWKIIVPNACESPDGYGTAWQLWQMNARVCMPVPLNLIAGAIRATWHWFRRGFYASGHSPRYADAMAWGEVRGYAFGLELPIGKAMARVASAAAAVEEIHRDSPRPEFQEMRAALQELGTVVESPIARVTAPFRFGSCVIDGKERLQ